MIEVLSGEGEDENFALVKVMDKIKEAVSSVYEYCVYTEESNHPQGMIQMTPPFDKCIWL